MIKDNYQSSKNGFNFGEKHHTISNNIIDDLTKIKEENFPFAIITPDGNWNEKGSMGWWGCVSDEKDKDDWKSIVRNIFIDFATEYKGVGCDLHI